MRVAAILLVLAGFVFGCCEDSTENGVEARDLPVESPLPVGLEGDPTLADAQLAFEFFINELEMLSENKLRLIPRKTPEGEQITDIFERVQAGSANGGIDVGHGLTSQATGVDGTSYFLGIPFGFEPQEHVRWLLYGGGLELQREMYAPHNVVPVPIGVVPESGGWFMNAIPDKLADFEQMLHDAAEAGDPYHLRWFGLGKDTLAAAFPDIRFASETAGSAPITYFGSNAPNEDDMLDGFEFSSANTDVSLLWDQLIDPPTVVDPATAGGTVYYRTWHQPTIVTEFWFNKDFWDSLPQHQRDLIDFLCMATLGRSVSVSQDDSLDFIASKGITVNIDWPEEILAALKDAARNIYTDHLTLDSNGKPTGPKSGDGSGKVLWSMIQFGWELPPALP